MIYICAKLELNYLIGLLIVAFITEGYCNMIRCYIIEYEDMA